MKNGGGAIMAMGRASGEHRVEKAIINALDSPLLYGNDIGKAKRILFNIYASEESPIFVREMQEIDDFFDQLDPNIDVIWGTAIDESLGEDAKVTILATGLEEDWHQEKEDVISDDEYFERLIPLLYRPVKKASWQITKKTEEAQAAPQEKEPVQLEEVPFTITPQPEPAPMEDTPVKDEPQHPHKEKKTMVDRWKQWMQTKFDEYTQEE